MSIERLVYVCHTPCCRGRIVRQHQVLLSKVQNLTLDLRIAVAPATIIRSLLYAATLASR